MASSGVHLLQFIQAAVNFIMTRLYMELFRKYNRLDFLRKNIP